MKVFGIAGWSGSGKTTLVTRLIPVLVRRGVEVATIKHSHHHPMLGDEPTRALVAAGVTEVLVASRQRFALMHDLPEDDEPGLAQLLDRITGIDLVLVEGFKFGPHPKLELWDPALGKPMLAPNDPAVLAIATDDPGASHGRPIFRRDDAEGIADFILSWDHSVAMAGGRSA